MSGVGPSVQHLNDSLATSFPKCKRFAGLHFGGRGALYSPEYGAAPQAKGTHAHRSAAGPLARRCLKIPAKRPFQNANASLVCILGYEIATFDKKLLRLISGN
jgi:hypothetical protein